MAKINIIRELKSDLYTLKKELSYSEEHLKFAKKTKDSSRIAKAEQSVFEYRAMIKYINSILNRFYESLNEENDDRGE